MTDKKNSSSEKSSKKKTYKKPEIKSEKILEAGLGAVCNGTATGGRKSVGPCTVIKT